MRLKRKTYDELPNKWNTIVIMIFMTFTCLCYILYIIIYPYHNKAGIWYYFYDFAALSLARAEHYKICSFPRRYTASYLVRATSRNRHACFGLLFLESCNCCFDISELGESLFHWGNKNRACTIYADMGPCLIIRK